MQSNGNTRAENQSKKGQQMEYCFNVYNKMAPTGIVLSLGKMLKVTQTQPGHTVHWLRPCDRRQSWTHLRHNALKKEVAAISLSTGTLKKTITAKEIKYMNEFLHETHPNSPVIAIDAAVGDAGGHRAHQNRKQRHPSGAGANKRLAEWGILASWGSSAEKSVFNYSLLNLTRLNLVYRMADIIFRRFGRFCRKNLPSRTRGSPMITPKEVPCTANQSPKAAGDCRRKKSSRSQ